MKALAAGHDAPVQMIDKSSFACARAEPASPTTIARI